MRAPDGLAGWDGRVRVIALEEGLAYAAALYVGGDDDTIYLAQGDKTEMEVVASYLNNLLEDESDEQWGFVRYILPRLREAVKS